MKRILFADNIKSFADTRAEFLSRAGYEVIKAYTIGDAIEYLRNTWIHLAILDIRLTDDSNEEDISGLELATNPQFAEIPKIMLTAFSSFDFVRTALGISEQGFQPAVAFFDKQEDVHSFIQAVNKAFDLHVSINFNLRIYSLLEIAKPFHYLASFLSMDIGESNYLSNAIEIEDLFRKLFGNYCQIQIGRILWRQEDHLGVEVYAYDNRHWQDAFVVSVGGRTNSTIQVAQHEEYRWSRSAEAINPQMSVRTLHYSAVAWSNSHIFLENALPINEFFKLASNPTIRNCLGNFIVDHFRGEIQKSSIIETNLNEAYSHHLLRLTREELFLAAERCGSAASRYGLAQVHVCSDKIEFQFPGGQTSAYKFPDLNHPILLKLLLRNLRVKVSKVNPNLHAAVVGEDERVWIYDFTGLENLPIFYQLSSLETYFRFRLMDETNLVSLLDFNRQLFSGTLLSDLIPLDQVEPSCRKVLIVALAIRSLIKELTNIDKPVYMAALLIESLFGLTKQTDESELTFRQAVDHTHRLLFSGMIMDSLIKNENNNPLETNSPAVDKEIRLEKDTNEISFNNRSVKLTSREFALMIYFFEHCGQLCTRRQLLREVFKYPDETSHAADQIINSNIQRLQAKIKQIAGEAIFFTTIREKGYIFNKKPGI